MNKGKVEKESKSESDDLQEISQLLHLNTNFEKNYRQINPLDTLQKKTCQLAYKKQVWSVNMFLPKKAIVLSFIVSYSQQTF
jgi:hypothetical protein